MTTPVGDTQIVNETEEVGEALEAETNSEESNEAVDPKILASRLDKANREAVNLRARVKALEPAAKELEKLREGEKSELQRATDALAESERQILSMTVSAFRRDAALAAGLDAEMVEFITGDTEDEAKAQADKLAKRLKATEKPKPGSPDLRQGQRGSATQATTDKNSIIRQMAGFQP